MFRHSKLFLSVGVAVSCLSSSVFAAGFQVNEHSANGLGRAFAGQAATPENASVLATNPAAIGVFEKTQLSGAISFIDPNVDVAGQSTSTALTPAGRVTVAQVEASEDNIADTAIVPAFFYITPIDDELSFGLGGFTTYGLRTDYGSDFGALNFADTAEVKSFTLNPTLAYKVSDTLRVGFGVGVTYADAEISSALPDSLTPIVEQGLSAEMGTAITLPENASILKLEGDDWGFGWNAGIFWQPTEMTNVGLSYRSETKLELDGEVSSILAANLNQPGSLDLNLAAITELAVNQKITNQWSVQASVVFTDWSTFEKLEANLQDGTDQLIKQENFDDSWRGALGVTYILNDEFTLRAGYAYDDGVVTTENRSLSIPDTDRHWVTGGLTYNMSKETSVDFGYAYINGREADINKTRALGETGIESTMVGTQSANAHILSVQVNTSF
ncbi:OmpP1/FadL family transporter [Salinimonas sediminis]|uniref:Long-chain fatty acid transporter n=1 Tax=Salinimonas sediminis TaxID=2303538 RepID=A0A346NN95_9ALTE|nr:porin [Salinimonas sediminis]AXR07002.1 long-chain fatty acid transporter [Salinimonas sediminis]